jgi:hypothetical protein
VLQNGYCLGTLCERKLTLSTLLLHYFLISIYLSHFELHLYIMFKSNFYTIYFFEFFVLVEIMRYLSVIHHNVIILRSNMLFDICTPTQLNISSLAIMLFSSYLECKPKMFLTPYIMTCIPTIIIQQSLLYTCYFFIFLILEINFYSI